MQATYTDRETAAPVSTVESVAHTAAPATGSETAQGALFAAAVEHLRAVRYPEAISLLEQVLASSPECAPAHAYVGLAYYFVKEVEPAIWHTDRAIALDPQDFLSWAKRGELRFHLACFAQAAEDLVQALQLEPPTPASRRWAAKLCEAAQERARGSFTRTTTVPAWGSWTQWARQVSGAATRQLFPLGRFRQRPVGASTSATAGATACVAGLPAARAA